MRNILLKIIVFNNLIQKKPFAGVFQNRCSKKFRILYRKKPVLESLFDKSCRPESFQTYEKETPTQMFSCEYCESFKNSFFYRTLLVAASAGWLPWLLVSGKHWFSSKHFGIGTLLYHMDIFLNRIMCK